MDIFQSTLSQTVFLFSLIIIGYILGKGKFIPEQSSAVLAKFENIVFLPALILNTFIESFTVDQLVAARDLMLVSFAIIFASIPIAVVISKILAKDKYTQNIYAYGLVFSNFGFMGNAVVSAIFPEIFFEYLLYTLPLWIMAYVWGVPVLLIAGSGEKQSPKERAKAFANPMLIAMVIGMLIGVTGIHIPQWTANIISSLGSCMSPVAMLLTGVTVSKIQLKKTLLNFKIYLVSVIRLLLIPLVFLLAAKIIPFSKTIFTCAACALAMPLGLSPVVVPSAYGKDTSTAAGLTVVSHLLSCITIPVIFMLIK